MIHRISIGYKTGIPPQISFVWRIREADERRVTLLKDRQHRPAL